MGTGTPGMTLSSAGRRGITEFVPLPFVAQEANKTGMINMISFCKLLAW